MTIPLIKICGITRLEDLLLCEELNIEYVGFNFVPSSPRCLDLKKAKELRSRMTRAKAVGIFADHTPDDVDEIAKELSLDFVQLHGSEDPHGFMSLGHKLIKAYREMPSADLLEALHSCDILTLLDGLQSGSLANWERISALPPAVRGKVMLSGGLTPENVADEAVRLLAPFAADVASGIESAPGIKDHHKLRAFVAAVRNINTK